MPNQTSLTIVGIARETTYGTPVVPNMFVPVLNPKPKDDIKYLEDKGLRGSLVDVYGYVAGMATSEYAWDGNVDTTTIGFPLAAIFGDQVTTGSAAPYVTVFAAGNSTAALPGSYTITDYNAVDTRTYSGCYCSDVEFKVNGSDLFTYSVKWAGQQSVTATKPTAPSYSTTPVRAGWKGTVKIGGVSSSIVEELDLTFTRSVDPVMTVEGKQTPYSMWVGNLSATGKITMVFENDTNPAFSSYLSSTPTSLDLNFNLGTNDILDFQMSSVQFSSVEIDRSKTYTELSGDFDAIANTTDVGASGGFSPAKVTLTNSTASGSY